jgi:hypothetical protein
MVSRKEWYTRVNAAWPDVLPIPTAEEAKRAARKMYRFVMGRKLQLPIQITSGNRFTYGHGGKLFVNPNRQRGDGETGWDALIHDLSHWLHRKVNPEGKPHDKAHAKLELRMRKEVLRRGWLAGTLKAQPKPETPLRDPRAEKLTRLVARRKAWMTRAKRAATALAKLKRQIGYYERTGVAS